MGPSTLPSKRHQRCDRRLPALACSAAVLGNVAPQFFSCHSDSSLRFLAAFVEAVKLVLNLDLLLKLDNSRRVG
jgi:hypothetical protein